MQRERTIMLDDKQMVNDKLSSSSKINENNGNNNTASVAAGEETHGSSVGQVVTGDNMVVHSLSSSTTATTNDNVDDAIVINNNNRKTLITLSPLSSVYYDESTSLWKVSMKIGDKIVDIGSYTDEDKALKAHGDAISLHRQRMVNSNDLQFPLPISSEFPFVNNNTMNAVRASLYGYDNKDLNPNILLASAAESIMKKQLDPNNIHHQQQLQFNSNPAVALSPPGSANMKARRLDNSLQSSDALSSSFPNDTIAAAGSLPSSSSFANDNNKISAISNVHSNIAIDVEKRNETTYPFAPSPMMYYNQFNPYMPYGAQPPFPVHLPHQNYYFNPYSETNTKLNQMITPSFIPGQTSPPSSTVPSSSYGYDWNPQYHHSPIMQNIRTLVPELEGVSRRNQLFNQKVFESHQPSFMHVQRQSMPPNHQQVPLIGGLNVLKSATSTSVSHQFSPKPAHASLEKQSASSSPGSNNINSNEIPTGTQAQQSSLLTDKVEKSVAKLAGMLKNGGLPVKRRKKRRLDPIFSNSTNYNSSLDNSEYDLYKASNKTSRFRGVCWYKRTSKWVVQTKINGKR